MKLIIPHVAVCALLGTFACKSDSANAAPARDTYRLENDGIVCFRPGNASIEVTVVIPACVGNGCTVVEESGCEAALGTDGRIAVSSWATIEQLPDGYVCNDSCDPVQTGCELSVTAGEYAVVHGAREAMVVLPVEEATTVIGDPGVCEQAL